METNEQAPYNPISDAYCGRSIFVTGSTGFIGKVFVEKILYRCPKIEKIYILIRDTEKVGFEEKFKKMLDSPVFKRLREERPQDLEKLVPIVGDITLSNLGLKIEDEKLLTENVSMVFHFAATIKFNEPLQYAIDVNLEGTRRLLDLCVRMKKIKVFLYVSTAFTGATRKELDEVVYPPPASQNDIDDVMKQKNVTEEQTKKILNGNPNTYTLTKALAENLVANFHEREDIRTVIVRPSIVISCKDEPTSGWIDNWFGATSLVVSVGKGLIRTLPADGDNNIDLIPADYVANLIIVAAAKSERSKSLEVYNSCTSAANPITIKQLQQIIINDSTKNKSNDMPLPGLFFIKSRWIMSIFILLLEILPAYIADCFLRLIGKKPMYMKLLSKISEVRKALEPFTSRTWMMRSNNTCALSESLSPTDRRLFACDPATIDWQEFLPTYFQGIRNYLMSSKIR